MPVGVLVESDTTQVVIGGIVEHHVADGIFAVDAGNALIAYIGYGHYLTVGQIRAVEELEVVIVHGHSLTYTVTVHTYLEYAPQTAVIDLGEQQTVGVPVQVQVGGRTSALGLVDGTEPHVAGHVGELGNGCVEAHARGRHLIGPVVGLRTQLGSHSGARFIAQLIATHDNITRLEIRVGQHDLALEVERLLRLGQLGIRPCVYVYAAVEQRKKLPDLRLHLGGIEPFDGLHIVEGIGYALLIDPFELALHEQHLLGVVEYLYVLLRRLGFRRVQYGKTRLECGRIVEPLYKTFGRAFLYLRAVKLVDPCGGKDTAELYEVVDLRGRHLGERRQHIVRSNVLEIDAHGARSR